MICHREGCPRLARWAPKVCVPVRGLPDSYVMHTIIVGEALCDHHSQQVMARDYLEERADNDGNELVACFRALGAPRGPDFERARVERVELDGEEYLSLVRAKWELRKRA